MLHNSQVFCQHDSRAGDLQLMTGDKLSWCFWLCWRSSCCASAAGACSNLLGCMSEHEWSVPAWWARLSVQSPLMLLPKGFALLVWSGLLPNFPLFAAKSYF